MKSRKPEAGRPFRRHGGVRRYPIDPPSGAKGRTPPPSVEPVPRAKREDVFEGAADVGGPSFANVDNAGAAIVQDATRRMGIHLRRKERADLLAAASRLSFDEVRQLRGSPIYRAVLAGLENPNVAERVPTFLAGLQRALASFANDLPIPGTTVRLGREGCSEAVKGVLPAAFEAISASGRGATQRVESALGRVAFHREVADPAERLPGEAHLRYPPPGLAATGDARTRAELRAILIGAQLVEAAAREHVDTDLYRLTEAAARAELAGLQPEAVVDALDRWLEPARDATGQRLVSGSPALVADFALSRLDAAELLVHHLRQPSTRGQLQVRLRNRATVLAVEISAAHEVLRRASAGVPAATSVAAHIHGRLESILDALEAAGG